MKPLKESKTTYRPGTNPPPSSPRPPPPPNPPAKPCGCCKGACTQGGEWSFDDMHVTVKGMTLAQAHTVAICMNKAFFAGTQDALSKVRVSTIIDDHLR